MIDSVDDTDVDPGTHTGDGCVAVGLEQEAQLPSQGLMQWPEVIDQSRGARTSLEPILSQRLG